MFREEQYQGRSAQSNVRYGGATNSKKLTMESGLKSKIALLTGSSDGIGRAAAHAFAAEGVMLALCSRGETKLRKTAGEIESKYGVEVLAEPVDVTNFAAMQ